MTTGKVSAWYDAEGDLLEVLWAFREGYFTPTNDERILKRLDDDGQVIGFLIHEMSTLKQSDPIEFDIASEKPAADVANVTVRPGGHQAGHFATKSSPVGLGGPSPRSDQARRGMADSHPHRSDSGTARPQRCSSPPRRRQGPSGVKQPTRFLL